MPDLLLIFALNVISVHNNKPRYLGVAFSGLRGKTLFPIVSSVWGHCEVKMRNHLLPSFPHKDHRICNQHQHQQIQGDDEAPGKHNRGSAKSFSLLQAHHQVAEAPRDIQIWTNWGPFFILTFPQECCGPRRCCQRGHVQVGSPKYYQGLPQLPLARLSSRGSVQ